METSTKLNIFLVCGIPPLQSFTTNQFWMSSCYKESKCHIRSTHWALVLFTKSKECAWWAVVWHSYYSCVHMNNKVSWQFMQHTRSSTKFNLMWQLQKVLWQEPYPKCASTNIPPNTVTSKLSPSRYTLLLVPV